LESRNRILRAVLDVAQLGDAVVAEDSPLLGGLGIVRLVLGGVHADAGDADEMRGA